MHLNSEDVFVFTPEFACHLCVCLHDVYCHSECVCVCVCVCVCALNTLHMKTVRGLISSDTRLSCTHTSMHYDTLSSLQRCVCVCVCV